MTAMLLAVLLFAPGCQLFVHHVRSPMPIKAQDNTKRLAAHPQYQRAVWAAPEWVGAAEETIVRLEKELANAGR